MTVLQQLQRQQYQPNSGESVACCRRSPHPTAVSTHLCSTTSPHCNNPLYLLHSLFLSFTRNLSVTAVSLNCRRRTPSHSGNYACLPFWFITHFQRFSALPSFPSMAAIPLQNQFFATNSRSYVSKKIPSRHIPTFFLSFIFTLHSVLSTSFTSLSLRRPYAIGSFNSRHQ